MRKLIITITLFALVVLTAAARGDREREMDTKTVFPVREGYSSIDDESIAFDFQWKVEGTSLKVQMAAPTTGWVAIGIDPSNMMADADFHIGYVSDGSVYLRDDFGDGAVKHSADKELGGQDNHSDIKGEEYDGATIIRYTIPLDSGDEFDKKLEPGKTYKVIYAYGPDDKDDFKSYHAKRGSFEVTL